MPPPNAQALLQQALQHHQAGRLAPAASLYAQVRKLLPGQFEPQHLGGVAALQLGRYAEAVELLRRALSLNRKSATTWMCLGLAQGHLGQRTEAEASLRQSVQLEPSNHEAWTNLASVFAIAGKLQEAADAYERAIRLKPDVAQAHTGLGSVYQLMGRAGDAIECHTRALTLDPIHPKAQSSRAQSYQSLHHTAAALADFEAHLARQPSDLEAASYRLLLLNYSAALSREELFAEHRAFGLKVEAQSRVRPRAAFANPRSADRRLRVAFLSPDLRMHSVTYFLEPLLQHLDRNQFEVVLYHDHFCEDDVSRRLAKGATLWRNFIGQPAERVEETILADAPDLLVDLAGHTGFNRLAVLGRRVAPVQISYLGYPNTTGLQTMDFRFTDAIADPLPEAQAHHTERLVHFSSTAWCYAPPADAPAVTAPPCLSREGLTFGSFNNLSKTNEPTLQLWARVLAAVPGSRLLLKSFGLREAELRTRAAAAGIDPGRLELFPFTRTVPEHLACYSAVDVALDPYPYHGTTTTCEALWMGVPVLCLQGDRHAARVGASLLTAVGQPEWIAQNPDDYVRLATGLASDHERLRHTRTTLRQQMSSSPLLDHAGQARRFGEALRACWNDACRT